MVGEVGCSFHPSYHLIVLHWILKCWNVLLVKPCINVIDLSLKWHSFIMKHANSLSYWCYDDMSSFQIQRFDINGRSMNSLTITVGTPKGIVCYNNMLYFADSVYETIFGANLTSGSQESIKDNIRGINNLKLFTNRHSRGKISS